MQFKDKNFSEVLRFIELKKVYITFKIGLNIYFITKKKIRNHSKQKGKKS